jgi:hypothetical protein
VDAADLTPADLASDALTSDAPTPDVLAPDTSAPDALTLETMECMRCHREEPMRFYGLCGACRAELREKFDRGTRRIEVAAYEPKMNVTPNAVALKDD